MDPIQFELIDPETFQKYRESAMPSVGSFIDYIEILGAYGGDSHMGIDLTIYKVIINKNTGEINKTKDYMIVPKNDWFEILEDYQDRLWDEYESKKGKF